MVADRRSSQLAEPPSPTALEFINNNEVNALLVGGLNNVDNAQSPITVADSGSNGSPTPRSVH